MSGKDGDKPKPERPESLSPEKIALMIEILNEHTDYKVVTAEEYDRLNQSRLFDHSTPLQDGAPARPPPPVQPPVAPIRKSSVSRMFDIGNRTGVAANVTTVQTAFSKPRIPLFSGEEKSEVTFDVWKFEVKCIIREGNYSEAVLLQCMRGSLKGKARSLLLSLPEDASPQQIIDKLEGVYGNVFSSEALLQKFYMESQQPNQSVAEYGMKIEGILQLAIDKGQINPQAKNEMLRSKFWSGLRDPLLKNASRYKYDTIKDFDQLRKEVRSIELDLANGSDSKVQYQATVAQSDKMDELLKGLQGLNKKMVSMEGELKRLKEENVCRDKGNFNNSRTGQQLYHGRFSAQNRGQYRGGRRNFGARANYSYNRGGHSDRQNQSGSNPSSNSGGLN